MAFSVLVTTVDQTPASNLMLEIISFDQKSRVGIIGPTDEDGLAYGSLVPGDYYFAIFANNKAKGTLKHFTVADTDFHTFEFILSSGAEVYSPNQAVETKIKNLEKEVQKIELLQRNLLSQSEERNLRDYLESLLEDTKIREQTALGRVKSITEQLSVISDQYANNYWGRPVQSIANLPASEKPYTIRLVIDEAKLYVKNVGLGWSEV